MDALEFAEARIALVDQLAHQFGYKKINLCRPGTSQREGIWCVPVTEDDNRKMKDDSSNGETIHVYLSNMPLPWGGRTWGSEVIGITCGVSRPEALSEDQDPLDDEVKLLWEGLRIKEAEGRAIAVIEQYGADALAKMTPEQRTEAIELLHGGEADAKRVLQSLDEIEAKRRTVH